ncbi:MULTISPECIES: sugar ABC transporter ATP-binding protein [Paraburkholderia]|uniref:sugar ABC transporter ATP-binding protein n=1 Tax=Paraburkholderia TaxID=1822464 RepID=UPI00036114F7|nr:MULTISPECIES: sugar ABC transporter ATP-binding protein [Paraburkholderia]MDH6151884.1 ribose transport system ATP-binding protein [Paraburkholderia sp. WSM4179]
MNPLISVNNLCKSFPGVRALHDVRFELMAGEVHALMGENGAGKSTLMKILAGVYTRDSGEILFDGKHVDFQGPRDAQAVGIGIIHQELQLMNHLSIAQNIFIGREPRKGLGLFLDEDKLNAQASEILARMHVKLDPRTITDRVTVMRDGEYVATVPTEGTGVETIIGMMVGRTLGDVTPVESAPVKGELALEVRNLVAGPLVRDVSFELRKGEILGFAGLMGAGRTEVARAVFGADPVESGEILVKGVKASIKRPSDAVKRGIGYLSEDRKRFGLATGMDVESNIVMADLGKFLSINMFLRRGQIRKRAQHFIKLLAIRTPSATQQVRLLSGGNQQKIVIAKWLERDCDVLFFDEPTRGIDVGAKSEIYKLLRSLAAQGKAIVMISSELPEVLRMSDRIVVMCEGRITGELSASEATQERIMHLATLRETLKTVQA